MKLVIKTSYLSIHIVIQTEISIEVCLTLKHNHCILLQVDVRNLCMQHVKNMSPVLNCHKI